MVRGKSEGKLGSMDSRARVKASERARERETVLGCGEGKSERQGRGER